MNQGIVIHNPESGYVTTVSPLEPESTHSLPTDGGRLLGVDDIIIDSTLFSSMVSTSIAGIPKPIILSPLANSTSFKGYVQLSQYVKTSELDKPHYATDWELSLSDTFSELEDFSYSNTVSLTEHTFKTSLVDTYVYIRARYQTIDFVGEWSNTVRVLLAPIYIGAPIVELGRGSVAYNSHPTFTATRYVIQGSDDDHVATDWVLATDSNFTNIVYESKMDTINLTSLILPITLKQNTDYYIKARYHSSMFYSSYSDTLTFSTNSTIPLPVLSGSTITTENTTTAITIDNYDINNSYEVAVSNGSYTLTGNTIYWSSGSVTDTITHTVAVTAGRIIDGTDVSSTSAFNIIVINRDEVADQSLVYDSANFYIAFSKRANVTGDGKITAVPDVDLMDHSRTSSTSTIFLDNKLIKAKVGDIFLTEAGIPVHVMSVGHGITLYIDPAGSSHYDNYWIKLATPLASIPTKIISTYNRASAQPIVQDATDNDFIGLRNITVTEQVINIQDNTYPALDNKIYINNQLLNVYPGQRFITDTYEEFEVATVADDGTSTTGTYKDKYWVTPIATLTTIPNKVYPVTKLVLNDTTATIASTTITADTLVTVYNDIEFAPIRTLDIDLDVGTTNSILSVKADILKEK